MVRRQTVKRMVDVGGMFEKIIPRKPLRFVRNEER